MRSWCLDEPFRSVEGGGATSTDRERFWIGEASKQTACWIEDKKYLMTSVVGTSQPLTHLDNGTVGMRQSLAKRVVHGKTTRFESGKDNERS